MTRLIQYNLFFFIFITTACSDYQAGYQQGINGLEDEQWLVFGKEEYMRGYHAGSAEKFQQDWLAENPLDIAGLVCRLPEMKSGATIIMPAGYENIGNDIFQSIE
ncbi:MAG: hypothetical protein AAF410_06930 [Pseudomonadota bacterium]